MREDRQTRSVRLALALFASLLAAATTACNGANGGSDVPGAEDSTDEMDTPEAADVEDDGADDAEAEDEADGEAWTLPPNRAYEGAPPTMMHQPFGCDVNCLTCHETGAGGAPVTPHPDRPICTQCHLRQWDVPDRVESTFDPY